MSKPSESKLGRPKRIPTEEEIHKIKGLFRLKMPWRDIAEETGISLRTIMRWRAADPDFWEDCTVHCRVNPYTKRDQAYWETLRNRTAVMNDYHLKKIRKHIPFRIVFE